jgi:serine/threonine protein kinase
MEQVGSRFYIPPESEDGRAELVSGRSDLYSIGKVLYYVASGGVIFAREKQRQPEFDLATVGKDPYLEAISRIVDMVVIDDPRKRLETALDLQNRIAAARDCITRRLPCAGVEKTYRCVFCGVGFYRQVCLTKGSHNEGYNEGNIGAEEMVFLECNVCGNCQRFKLKYAGEAWFPDAYRSWRARR